ncbi:MAG TPA: ferritin-like domain-containing protein [Aliidongia sp.]|nr:ferritin-like domain-containing protein [Aliidongia sp.]
MSPTTIEAADYAMRHWIGPGEAPVRLGSREHLWLFGRMLLDTHNPYKPAIMVWPELDQAALARLTSLPIWDIAVQTEGRASIRVKTFAETIRDPLLREALDMDAGEEARHKVVLSHLVASYGIKLAPEPDYPPPQDPEWAWLVTGYSECIDSFFAFGLFALAKQSGYFPPELVETFEPVIQEEARHILFFANWVAWHRRRLGWLARIGFEARVLAVWAFLIWERIGIARGIDANFAMTGGSAVGVDLSPRQLVELCLAENERRMAGYDKRLLRPTTVPFLAALARRFLPKPKPSAMASAAGNAS